MKPPLTPPRSPLLTSPRGEEKTLPSLPLKGRNKSLPIEGEVWRGSGK